MVRRVLAPPKAQEVLIRRTASRVAKHGGAFEAALREAAEVRSDARFRFLFDPGSDEGLYYGVCVVQALVRRNGAARAAVHVCGPHAVQLRGDSERFEVVSPRVEALIEACDGSRSAVRAAMGACLDHAEDAEGVAALLGKALAAPGDGGAQRTLSVLYVVSDVLHNSAKAPIRNAWRYRELLQALLPGAFRTLRRAARAFGGIAAAAVLARARALVRVWQRWAVYDEPFLRGLDFALVGDPMPASAAEGGAAEGGATEGGAAEGEAVRARAARLGICCEGRSPAELRAWIRGAEAYAAAQGAARLARVASLAAEGADGR